MKATTKITTGKTKLAELIANTAMVLPAELAAETTSVCRGEAEQGKRWSKLGDHYYAAGVRFSMLEGKGNGVEGAKDPRYQALQDQIRDAIRASFDESVQTLFTKEPKTLSQVDKKIRAYYWTTQTTSLFGLIRRYVKAVEDNGGKPKGKTEVKTGLAKVRKVLTAQIDYVKKIKPEKLPDGFKVQEFVNDIKAVMAKHNLPS